MMDMKEDKRNVIALSRLFVRCETHFRVSNLMCRFTDVYFSLIHLSYRAFVVKR